MFRFSTSLLVLCATTALLSVATSTTRAQSQATFRGRVDLVQLDVIVLDKNRKPVTGLSAKDFTVLEGGRAVPIEAFTAISLPGPLVTEGAAWMREVAPDVVTNVRAEDGRLVVIVMDRTIPAGEPTIVARTVAHSVIDALGPADLAAVIRTSGFTGEGMQQNFTADRQKLRSAIDTPFLGLTISPSDIGGLTPGSGECMCGVCVLESITRTADALALESRRHKMLLFIGSEIGIEGRAWSSLGLGQSAEECQARLLMERERTLRAIDRANVTFHSLDPRALETLGYSAAQRGRPSVFGARSSNLLRQSDLASLPDYTGGRAVNNTNRPGDLMRAIFDESQSYYLLGFRRSDVPAKERRNIRVRVNRDGAIVRSRSGYYAPVVAAQPGPADPPADALSELLPRADIPLSLALTPRFAPDGSTEVHVRFGLGWGGSAAGAAPASTGSANGNGDEYDVLIGVFDHQARHVRSERHALGVPRATRDRQAVESQAVLALKAGRYEVRLGITDLAASRSGSVYGYVEVPDIAEQPLSLSGVLLGASSGQTDGSLAPTTSSGLALTTLLRVFAATDVATASVQAHQRGPERKTVLLRTRIVDSSGRDVTTSTRELSPADFGASGVANVRLQLPLTSLTPGPYLFAVELTGDRRIERRDVPFSVR